MLYRRGRIWWFKFRVAGRLFQESTRTTSKTVAAPAERQRRRDLEERINGLKKRERPVAFTLAARTWLATREPTVARNSHPHRPSEPQTSPACVRPLTDLRYWSR